MAEQAFAGGMQMLYGVLIRDALQQKGADTQELAALSDQARAALLSQADLQRAVEELDREIARRSGAKGGGEAERFVIEAIGLGLSAEVRRRLESRLKDVVLEELAGVDTGGDLVATPLSDLKAFPGGHPGLAGMFIRQRAREL